MLWGTENRVSSVWLVGKHWTEEEYFSSGALESFQEEERKRVHLSVCSCVPHPAQCQPSRKCCMIVECVCEAYPETPLYILCNHLRSHGHGFRPHNPYVCTPRVFSGCWRALPLTSTLMICGTPFLSCPFAKILLSWVNNLPSHLYFRISSGGGEKSPNKTITIHFSNPWRIDR